MSRHQASCSCGQLRADADGDPTKVSVCHCLACQQRTGSAFGVQARFAPEQVTVTGESREYQRAAEDDGELRRFRFCPNCGATVVYDFGPGSDSVVIPVGAFADPQFPAPVRSIYESRQHAWVEITAPLTERWD
jgi:hypothetical protein